MGWSVELVVHDNTLASPVIHVDAENHPKAGADLADHDLTDEPTAQTHALDFADKASIKDLDVVASQEDDIPESGHQTEEQGAESCDTLPASTSPNKSTTVTALAIVDREPNSTPPQLPTQLFDWIVNLEVTRSRLFQVVIRATSVLRAPLVSALFAANVDIKVQTVVNALLAKLGERKLVVRTKNDLVPLHYAASAIGEQCLLCHRVIHADTATSCRGCRRLSWPYNNPSISKRELVASLSTMQLTTTWPTVDRINS
ncbi:hypothetical protein LTS18_005409, partial [Coniosporium uncinatum]